MKFLLNKFSNRTLVIIGAVMAMVGATILGVAISMALSPDTVAYAILMGFFIGIPLFSLGITLLWVDLAKEKDAYKTHAEEMRQYDFFPKRAVGDYSDRYFDFDAFLYGRGIERNFTYDVTGEGGAYTLLCKIGDDEIFLVTRFKEATDGSLKATSLLRHYRVTGEVEPREEVPTERLLLDISFDAVSPLIHDATDRHYKFPVEAGIFNLWRKQIDNACAARQATPPVTGASTTTS